MICLENKNCLKIGYKQTIKALNENKCSKVYIANDCDDFMKSKIENLSKEKNVPIIYVETMNDLGKMCGISRGASCVSVIS